MHTTTYKVTTTTYVLMHLYPSYISIDTYPQPTQPPLTQSYKPFGLDWPLLMCPHPPINSSQIYTKHCYSWPQLVARWFDDLISQNVELTKEISLSYTSKTTFFFFFVVYPFKLDQVESRRVDSPRSISICPGLIYMGEDKTSGPCIFC